MDIKIMMMIMFTCLHGPAPAFYLANNCTSTPIVPGLRAMRSGSTSFKLLI